MAHFAQLSDAGEVLQVIVVNNSDVSDLPYPESEPLGQAFCQSLFGPDTTWLQTSYNANFRRNYAGVGFTYNAGLDAFIPPKPFASWLLDAATCQCHAPVPYPTDGNLYFWDEAAVSWVPVPEEVE